MKKTTYTIVPSHLSTSEGLVKMLTTMDHEELDINLTLLGAPKLSSKDLSIAIANKTFSIGSHILVNYGSVVLPFKIMDYTEDGAAFCQSMISAFYILFKEKDIISYKISTIRDCLNSRAFEYRFPKDFVNNHVIPGNWDVESEDDPDSTECFNDKFSLMSLREMLTYCRTRNSKIRYNTRGEAIVWNVRDGVGTLGCTSNFINMTDDSFLLLKMNHPDMSNRVGIVPVCLVK